MNWINLFIYFYFLFVYNIKINAERFEKSYNDNKNPNFDSLTGFLYHAEHTKTCGDILRTLAIDFNDFWGKQFQKHVRKATKLAASLNYLINQYSNENEYLQKIDLPLLYSLSYFIFSNDNFDTIDPGKYSSSSAFIQVLKEKTGDGYKKFEYEENFIVTYGLIFNEKNGFDEENTKNYKYKKCIYISNGYKSNSHYSSENCSDLNQYKTKNSKSNQFNKNKIFMNGNSNDELINCKFF
jgi:hypothetical protein